MIRTAVKAALITAGGLAAIHAAPVVTSLRPLRARLTPGLCGLGDPAHVALTFDDGPHPRSTPHFLRLLDDYHVRATFFLLGEQVLRAPQLAAEIAAAGHEIALHGHTHRCLLARGPRATYADLARGRDVVSIGTGMTPSWYRPPYGVVTAATLSAARRLHLHPVLWTDWGRDWTRSATPTTVWHTVTRGLRGGATILLHDSDAQAAIGSWRSSLGALPRLIETCHERGLKVGPLADHQLQPPPARGTTQR